MSLPRRPFPRTSAPRSAVVHGLAIDVADHVTLCGRRIGDEWAGEYTDMPQGAISCRGCLRHLDPSVAVAVADFMADRDGGRIRNITHDATGDVVAEWNGCIVGVRFSSVSDAFAWMAGDRLTRPAGCPLASRGAVGDCVRAAGHAGKCASAIGDRYDGITQTETPTGTADEVARFSRELSAVLSPRSWEEMGHDEARYGAAADDPTEEGESAVAISMRESDARARSMANHPAGKGRPTRITDMFSGYPNAMRMEGATGRAVSWALAFDGRTIR